MNEDFKEEYLPRLERSLLYQILVSKCQAKDPNVIALVHESVSYAIQRTKTVISHMGEFTLHDGDHLFRVLHLMEKLTGEQLIKNLSAPELLLLILTAFFHDIGMAPDEKEVITWKKVWDTQPELFDDGERKTFEGFQRFYSARPDEQTTIDKLAAEGKTVLSDTIKSYLITEYIRQSHADRARDIIDKDWSGKITFRDSDLTVEFAQLCFSHNEDALKLMDMDKNYLCGENIYACIPLIGIILRLADILDFDAKRTPPVLFSHLYVRNPISVKEWQKHRSVEAWNINQEIIEFSAICSHPAIQSAVNQFCDDIDKELSISNSLLTHLNDLSKNKERGLILKLPVNVTRKIHTKKNLKGKPVFKYHDTKFTLSKRQVIDLLMGSSLYGKPAIALRELIQNSIDACLLRQAQERKWNGSNLVYQPEIRVSYYKENDDLILEVEDNGTGMDEYIIDNYYSKVGSSFYKSADFYTLKAEANADFQPTSRFGIGILSSFMVADSLIVDTKRVYAEHQSSDPLLVTVEGQESIFLIQEGKRTTPGTTTKLILRKGKNPWDNMSEEKFIESVESVIPNPPFKITIKSSSTEKTRDQYSFRNLTPESIKDYTWKEHNNIRYIDIDINREDFGIIGAARVAILQRRLRPVKVVKLNSRTVNVEGDDYDLEREIKFSTGKIIESSKSITIDDDGNIDESDSISQLADSISRLSLHGIEVPASLFPQEWRRKKNQVKLTWPFPMLLVVDVCGTRDLDLNASRTEIIISDKWFQFEENLAYIICTEIAKSVGKDYWDKLKELLVTMTENQTFLSALNRVEAS